MRHGEPEIIAHQHEVERCAMASVLQRLEECDAPGEDLDREVSLTNLVNASRRLVRAFDGESPLTFEELRRVNLRRSRRWHKDFLADSDPWTIADWSNAMVGEAGELANIIKKIRRLDTGAATREGEGDRDALVFKALKEAGDVIVYLDLLAAKLGFSLDTAVIEAFNQVSARSNFPEALDARRTEQ